MEIFTDQLNDASPQIYNCMDCGLDPPINSKQDYMLHDHLWLIINPKNKGILCIQCAEKRLGRKLINSDYKITPEEMFKRLKEYKEMKAKGLVF